jgi:hypothetical protein
VERTVELTRAVPGVVPERFYGFLGGDSSQWYPDLARDMFDDGWDAYRERTFDRQKQLGIVPPDAEPSAHDLDVPARESLTPDARRLATRMMELFGGSSPTPTTTSGGCWTS